MLKIPSGHERSGIKIKCTKCDWHVKDTCALTKKKINSCQYKDKHKFNLVFHVPGTKDGKISKILETTNFNEAIVERSKYKLELEKNNYHKAIPSNKQKVETNLYDLAIEYLNCISGEHPIELLNNKLSKTQISNMKLILGRFSTCMKDMGYTIKKLEVKDIGILEANEFLRFIREYSESESLHAKHQVGMKTFINWCIKVKDIEMKNPFKKAKIRFEKKDDQDTIEKEEFEALLKIVTLEHGYHKFKNENAKEKGKNLYRDYLVTGFKLALETGCRVEELAGLKWSHLRKVSNNAEMLQIINLKVTR